MTVYPAAVNAHVRAISTPQRVEIANAAIDLFKATAPVVTGEYSAGGAVSHSGDDVAMINRDPTARYKEYGTEDTPAHASMVNAARRFGRYVGWAPRAAAAL